MARRIVAVILALAVVGGGAFAAWWHLYRNQADDGKVTLYGHVEIRDAQLAFQEQERVVAVLVEEGDVVEPGQVLARLDDARLKQRLAEAAAQVAAQREVVRRLVNGTRQQEIDQARAKVKAAEARVANAQRIVERREETTRRGASPQQALDDARADLDIARADLNVQREALALALDGAREEDIAQARATLAARRATVALLERRLDDTILRAPARGVIQSRIMEPGEMAMPSRPAFVLALTEPKWVRAYLPQPQMGLVHKGMPARVFTDSFPDRPFTGWVGFISPTAEFTPKNVQTTDLRTELVYEVRVWVRDPQDQLRLGAPVTVKIDPSTPSSARPGAGAGSQRGTSGTGRESGS